MFRILLFEIPRNLNCILDGPKTLVQMVYVIVLDSIVSIITQYDLHSDQLSDVCRARGDSYEVVRNESGGTDVCYYRMRFSCLKFHATWIAPKTKLARSATLRRVR